MQSHTNAYIYVNMVFARVIAKASSLFNKIKLDTACITLIEKMKRHDLHVLCAKSKADFTEACGKHFKNAEKL